MEARNTTEVYRRKGKYLEAYGGGKGKGLKDEGKV